MAPPWVRRAAVSTTNGTGSNAGPQGQGIGTDGFRFIYYVDFDGEGMGYKPTVYDTVTDLVTPLANSSSFDPTMSLLPSTLMYFKGNLFIVAHKTGASGAYKIYRWVAGTAWTVVNTANCDRAQMLMNDQGNQLAFTYLTTDWDLGVEPINETITSATGITWGTPGVTTWTNEWDDFSIWSHDAVIYNIRHSPYTLSDGPLSYIDYRESFVVSGDVEFMYRYFEFDGTKFDEKNFFFIETFNNPDNTWGNQWVQSIDILTTGHAWQLAGGPSYNYDAYPVTGTFSVPTPTSTVTPCDGYFGPDIAKGVFSIGSATDIYQMTIEGTWAFELAAYDPNAIRFQSFIELNNGSQWGFFAGHPSFMGIWADPLSVGEIPAGPATGLRESGGGIPGKVIP